MYMMRIKYGGTPRHMNRSDLNGVSTTWNGMASGLSRFPDYTFEKNELLENKKKEEIEKLLSPTGLERVDSTTLSSSTDLRRWCSKIEDQGQIGSCTANAGAGVMEYFENRAFGKYLDASSFYV